jgi:hypothetical protein
MKSRRPAPKAPAAKAPAAKAPAAKAPATAPSSGLGGRAARVDRPTATAGAKAPGTAAPAAAVGAVLPGTTRELVESRTLQVKHLATWVGAASMPPTVAAQLMAGIRAEGISEETTLQGVLSNYIDGGEVEVLSIAPRAGGAADTWLRFYCGDTEVGFIFRGGALHAIVGDQDINPV